MSLKRRDATRVICDILTLASAGVAKTQIVYQANLNFKQVDVYLSFLIMKGYLSLESRGEKVSGVYELTEKGRQLLEALQRVETQLEGLFSANQDKAPGIWRPSYRLPRRVPASKSAE